MTLSFFNIFALSLSELENYGVFCISSHPWFWQLSYIYQNFIAVCICDYLFVSMFDGIMKIEPLSTKSRQILPSMLILSNQKFRSEKSKGLIVLSSVSFLNWHWLSNGQFTKHSSKFCL